LNSCTPPHTTKGRHRPK